MSIWNMLSRLPSLVKIVFDSTSAILHGPHDVSWVWHTALDRAYRPSQMQMLHVGDGRY